jgi:hypothetical protein
LDTLKPRLAGRRPLRRLRLRPIFRDMLVEQEAEMTLKCRAATNGPQTAWGFLAFPLAVLMLVTATSLPASAHCRLMPDGRLMMMPGPFADDVDRPCPQFGQFQSTPLSPQTTQPEFRQFQSMPQTTQPVAPTMQFTTPMGPFTTGEIGPFTTAPIPPRAAPEMTRRR